MAEFKASQRGRHKMLFQGYIYVLDRDMGKKKYWRCEKRKFCNGRANSMDSHVVETSAHSHDRDDKDCKALEVVNEVKKRAFVSGEPADKIVSDTVQNVDESVASKLPSNGNLKRLVRRLRQSRVEMSWNQRRREKNAKQYPILNLGSTDKAKLTSPHVGTVSLTTNVLSNCFVKTKQKQSGTSTDNIDDKYFKGYSCIATHSDMIGDFQRTDVYRQAILLNYANLYGKTVVDVGCGTGILSMFCVKAGAKKVYAIEASDIVEETKKIIAANEMEDKIVVLHGKVEDIELPETVDVIVSEWMGYMLLFESMLQSVLHVRDRWLKQNGKMFPERAQLFIAPITESLEYTNRVEFWKTVKDTYDVDLSVLHESALQEICRTVSIIPVAPEAVHSHASSVFEIELTSVLPSELTNIEGSFRCSCFGHANVVGFVVWFAVSFPREMALSTSPYEDETHWRQSVLHIKPMAVQQDSIIEGTLNLRQNSQDYRCLDVELQYCLDGLETLSCTYKMSNEPL